MNTLEDTIDNNWISHEDNEKEEIEMYGHDNGWCEWMIGKV